MWLLRERLSDFREKNLQTLRAKSELLKSYIELIALYVHPKNSIAIMALDHSILGPRKQILGKQFRANFLPSKVYVTNSCQQVFWGRVKKPFILFIYITSEVKQYHEALFLSYSPRSECSISQFCNTNYTRSTFRTIEARVGF